MKTLTILVSILTAMFITTAVMANDTDSTRVEKKIIKTVIITDDGKVMVDSTFISENGKVTVHVDTMIMHTRVHGNRGQIRHIDGNRSMNWDEAEGDEFDVMVEMDGDSTHTMIVRNPKLKHKMMRFESDSLPMNCKKMIVHELGDMPCPPPPPPAPPVPGRFIKHPGMIDLNDPSIISYDKKVQKDGTEKITIIRKLD